MLVNTYFSLLHFASQFSYTQDMLTLPEATRTTRTILKIGGITFAVFFIIILVLRLVINILNNLTPKPPPTEEARFGILPMVSFTPNTDKYIYSLNTLTGGLPASPIMVKVYKVKRRPSSLLDIQNARNNLHNQNYSQGEKKISETVYEWTNNQDANFPISIRYNIVTGDFDIYSEYLKDQNVQSANHVLKKENATDYMFDYLERIGANVKDLDKEKVLTTYFRISEGKLTPVDAYNEAHILKVDLYQKSLDKMEVIYPYYYGSIMSFWIASGKYSPVIVAATFKHQFADSEDPQNSSTYNIISAEQAYENLKTGNAFVFNISGRSQIEISDIALAYYLGANTQDYVIPVYVFSGNQFKAYVHALPQNKFAPVLEGQ